VSKNYNYNYAFVFYDVGEKRVNKVFKICKKYLIHHQLSVFRGNITPSNLLKMKSEIQNTIVPNEDFVTIIKLISKSYFDEETLGTNKKDGTSLFI
jgi:CRISPR-associated protein Cas2